MHRFFAERRQKPKCQQVEIAIYKAVQTHEFGRPIFTCLMLYYLFTDLIEACIFSQIGNITMHLAIYLDVFYHSLAIGLQATVEIVKVLNATNFSCRSIKELRGNSF